MDIFGEKRRLSDIEWLLRQLERKIDRIIRFLIAEEVEEEPKIAISAKGELMPASIHVNGHGATFTFTEFDGAGGTGNKVPPLQPIVYASDNTAVATVDATGQVAAIAAGTANISGTDPGNSLTASDVLTVTADVAVSATGVLTANP
jgi:hypothetical protein